MKKKQTKILEKKKKNIPVQKYRQTSSKSFVSFDEADEYRNSLKKEVQKVKVKRRVKGFDVLVYEKIKRTKKNEQNKS